MSNIVNDRDVLLQGADSRSINPQEATILLRINPSTFHVDKNGVGTPSTAKVTATLLGLTGTVTLTADGATLKNIVADPNSTDTTATIAFADMTKADATVTATIVSNGKTFTVSDVISKLQDGSIGSDGTAATIYATATLYQWSTVQPALPNGTSSLSWAVGVNTFYSGTDNWSITVPANPGVSGIKLWAATKQVSAPAGTVSSTVSYASGAAVNVWTQNGQDGAAGIKSAQARVYQWATGPAPTIAGTSVYTWATNKFTTVPTGWSATKLAAPAAGYTLYEATVGLLDAAGATIANVDWTTASVVGVGYIATNGTNGTGTTGATGDAAMIAYVLIDGNSLNTTPSSVVVPGKALPTTATWGETRAWTAQPSIPAANQAVFMSNGIYSSVNNNTTWGVPYLSNLRVGSLSAISANLGAITAGSIDIGSGTAKIDASGNATFKSLTVKDASGNTIISSGTALNPTYAAPGTLNSDLTPIINAAATATFSPYKTWEFRNSTEGWYAYTGTATLATGADSITITSSGGDPILYSATGLAINGALFDKVRARVKRKGGTSWDGKLYYSNSSHGDNAAYYKSIPDTTTTANFVVLEWDMSTSSIPSDWKSGNVTMLRLDLGNSLQDVFEIDWITVGKYGPVNITDLGYTGDLNANYTTASKGAALNDDPNLENASNTWGGEFGSPMPAAVTVSRTSGLAGGSGLYYFAVPAYAGGDSKVETKRQFAIDPAKVYNLTALLYAADGNDRNQYIYINLYDSVGSWISTYWGGSMSGYSFGGLVPTTWTRKGGMIGAGTAMPIPANARTATIGVWFQYGQGTSNVAQGAMDIRIEEVTLAANALSAITAISSDNVLSRGEKPAVNSEWTVIYNERSGLVAQASSLGVDSSGYTAKFNALNSYLTGLGTGFTDYSTDFAINGTTFNTSFSDYYIAKQALLNAISAKAATTSNWTSVTNRPQDANNLVVKGSFEDGSIGLWNNGTVVSVTGQPFTKAIQSTVRDSIENVGFPVAAGEKIYVEGWLDATGCNFPVSFGLAFYNAAGAQVDWRAVVIAGAGSGWAFKKGSTTVPTTGGLVKAVPWILIDNGSSGVISGSARAAMLRLSRFENGATVGAVAGSNLVDANGVVLSDSAIKNSAISLGTDGALTGAGGGKVTLPGMGQNTFRAVSKGNSTPDSALPIGIGIYANGGVPYALGRSYTLVAIKRSDASVLFYSAYDVYGVGQIGGKGATDLAAKLNSYGSDVVVVVASYDEPQTNRLTGGLDTAMYRCGASRAVYGSANFKMRAAYILVGIPGCGEGNGAEAYQGSVDNDASAWCDLGFSIINGALTGVSTSFTPKSLTDYGYTGDLNATRGAPAGTLVGSTPAATVEANAAAGAAASSAVSNLSSSISDKLTKSGYDTISGQISLTAPYALLVGSTDNGIYYGSTGIYGRKGGATTFGISSDGTALFAGSLMAASGTLGALTLVSGGQINGGGYTGYAWPPSGVTGFHLSSNGLLLGNVNDNKFFQVTGDGQIAAPGFSIINGILTLTSPIINTPVMDTYSCASMASLFGSGPNGYRVYGSRTASVSGGKAPYTYMWSFSQEAGVVAPTLSGTTTATVTIAGSTTNNSIQGYAVCTITDANGRAITASFLVSENHGTGF